MCISNWKKYGICTIQSKNIICSTKEHLIRLDREKLSVLTGGFDIN